MNASEVVRREWRFKGSDEQWNELNANVQAWIDQCPPERQAQFECRELIVKPSHSPAVVAEPVAWQYRLHFLNRFGGVTEWAPCSADYEFNQDHSDLVRFEKRALYSQPAAQVPDEVMGAAERLCMPVDPARLVGTGLGGVTAKLDAENAKTIRDWLKSIGGVA